MKAVKLEQLKPLHPYVIKLPIGKTSGLYLGRDNSGEFINFCPTGGSTIALPVEVIVSITEGKPVLPLWPEAVK